MANYWMLAIAAAGSAMLPAPAFAQNAVQNGTLVIYGNDRCPTNADGEEIVVCVRRGEEERFRIPRELRNLEVTPENESWAARAESTLTASDTGVGSCSTVGPGGQTGCFVRRANAARAEARARRDAETNIPLP